MVYMRCELLLIASQIVQSSFLVADFRRVASAICVKPRNHRDTSSLSYPSQFRNSIFNLFFKVFLSTNKILQAQIAVMRYQNWDVLIFPLVGESKTPLQEFGTTCTVNQDPGKDQPSLHSDTTADQLNIRCLAFPKSFSTSGLLNRREDPVANCHMLRP